LELPIKTFPLGGPLPEHSAPEAISDYPPVEQSPSSEAIRPPRESKNDLIQASKVFMWRLFGPALFHSSAADSTMGTTGTAPSVKSAIPIRFGDGLSLSGAHSG
jgi:hypothetical protein